MNEHIEILKNECQNFSIVIDKQAEDRFLCYSKMLIDWNNRINLTAITEPKQIAIKHFIDSLLLLDAVEIKDGDKLLDVGTGAGFPGVPIKIARPGIELTLLDSLNKRLLFLQDVMREINLEATIIHSRAEEGSRKPALREQFDVVTSRAVANLNLLAEYCLPYVKVGGYFAAMKGPEVDDELKGAESAIGILGGRIEEVKRYKLPDDSRRSIILIRKISKTSDKYPRHGSKIAKKPL